MIPVFFGASESPLLGLLHEPEGDSRGHGVLLCPPIGQEHVRAHWALRQVAQSLARSGFHCFRFDWFGVGDSAGDLASATVARWREDALSAAQELKDAAGVKRISVVGLRLGATLAVLAAAKMRPSCVVLWDPVLRGASHLAELRRIHEEVLSDRQRYWHAVRRETPAGELLGFDFGPALLGEIGDIDITAGAELPRAHVAVVRSSPSPELADFAQALRARKLDAELATTDLPARWADAREVEELLLPAGAARLITEILERRVA